MKLARYKERHYTQQLFKSGKITCPVCGRTHRYHCSVTADGSLAICKYKPSERQSKDGRYIHILSAGNYTTAYTASPSPKPENETPRADADACHAVYTALLSHLKLSPAHGDSLLDERGLSDTTIAYKLYASVPDMAKGNRLARALARFFDLRGVPGFYYHNGRWRLNTHYKGYYVPYRDEQGRIIGLQIRRDGNADPKYVWLTSAGKPEGVSSSAPLHFVMSDLARHSKEVFITEGALKADRISEFKEISTVALAGVTAMSPDKFVAALQRALPEVHKATLVFDMDWQIKEEVKAALIRLLLALRATGFTAEVLTWELELGKGFDDALYRTERGKA